jgi:hypothetical protein
MCTGARRLFVEGSTSRRTLETVSGGGGGAGGGDEDVGMFGRRGGSFLGGNGFEGVGRGGGLRLAFVAKFARRHKS